MIEGDLKGAIEQYKKIAQGEDRSVAARALIRLAECYQKLGDAQAKTVYERLVREFGDQKDAVAIARARLARDTAAAAPAATTTQRVLRDPGTRFAEPSLAGRPIPVVRRLGLQ